MRKIFTVMGLFLSVTIFAQTHEIVKHNGQKMDVNFIKHDNNLLYYSHSGSSEEHKISKHAVAFLNDKKTAKSEFITSKITIDSKNDFGKVIILNSDHAIGFEKKTEFTGNHAVEKGGTSFFDNENSIRKVKYKSAELGGPFVTIVDKNNGKYEAVSYNY
jgi:hypothetical protein